MSSIIFKQTKPLTVVILGYFLAFIFLLFVVFHKPPLSQLLILFLLAFVLIGYSIRFEIESNYLNTKLFSLFGFVIFKQKLIIIFPEYIVLMPSTFSSSSDWGSVAALGKGKSNSFYVIRLFKGRDNFILYKSASLSIAKQKAEALSTLIGVPLKTRNI